MLVQNDLSDHSTKFECSSSLNRVSRDEHKVPVTGAISGEPGGSEQYQKTQLQSSEVRAYLARFLLSFASLRRFWINWYKMSRPSCKPSPVIAQAGCTRMHELPAMLVSSSTPKCFSSSPTSRAPEMNKKTHTNHYLIFFMIYQLVVNYELLFSSCYLSCI